MKVIYVTIVLVAALLTALDAVGTEAVMSAFKVHPLVVSSIQALIGGIVLFLNSCRKDKKFYIKFDKKVLIKIVIASIFGAVGLVGWFDAVTIIGASKELLLGGDTSEVLFILFLSFIFLEERLRRIEIVGSIVVLIGIFLIAFNPSAFSLIFGIGELEAILSSLSFAIATVLITNTLKKSDVQNVGSFYLILEGLVLFVPMFLLKIQIPLSSSVIFGYFALGIIYAFAVLTYNLGLKKTGASLTAVVASFAGLFSIILQFLTSYMFPSVQLIFPPNLILAITGGILAVLGVFLISY